MHAGTVFALAQTQETIFEELFFEIYVFAPSQVCIRNFSPSLYMDTGAVFTHPLMSIHENILGEFVSEQLHAAHVFAPRRIQENTPGELPSQPKLLQKILFKSKCFGRINFVKITNQSLYKANSFACSLENRDKPGQQHYKENVLVELCCNNYKDYYKHKCSKELFCSTFGQDGNLNKKSHGILKRPSCMRLGKNPCCKTSSDHLNSGRSLTEVSR